MKGEDATGNPAVLAGTAREESRIHDKYCWFCHEITTQHKCFRCVKCFRSFHGKCLAVPPKGSFICPACDLLEKSRESFAGKSTILGYLKYVKKEIENLPEIDVLKNIPDWKDDQYRPEIANPIHLNDILDKIKENQYESFAAFLAEIECIHHNCYIHYGVDHDIEDITGRLLEFCETEVDCINACDNCYNNYYGNKEKLRSGACDEPHLILWTKLSRSCEFWKELKGPSSYWPIKLLQVQGDKLKVVLFGKAEFIDVNPKNCWLYSTADPVDSDQSAKKNSVLKQALEDLDLYIRNLKRTFDDVVINLPSNSFDRRRVSEHMKAMFPEYRKRSNDRENAKNDAVPMRLEAEKSKRVRDDRSTARLIKPLKRPRTLPILCTNNDSAIVDVSGEMSAENTQQAPLRSTQSLTNDAQILDQINKLISDKNRIIEDLKSQLKDSNEQLRNTNEQLRYVKLERDKKTFEVGSLKDIIDDMGKLTGDLKSQLQKAHDDNTKLKEDTDLQTTMDAHRIEMALIAESHRQKMNKMHEKVQQIEARAELQSTITANILKKTDLEVRSLKQCTGCNKQLESFERFCNENCRQIWSNISLDAIDPFDTEEEV